jgi:parallel beta-helix repeat protein
MTSRSFAAVRAIAAFAAAAGLASPALAHRSLPVQLVVCGQVITESLRVGNDLLDCPGHGLVVGAANVTIDLGGHRIDGTGDADENGIDNQNGFDGVTVRGGVVSGFYNAVLFVGVDGGEISGIRAQGSTDQGIVLRGSHRIAVSRNVLQRSVHTGIFLESATENLLRDNLVVRSDHHGIFLYLGSDRNLLIGNETVGNGGSGIHVQSSSENVLKRNSSIGNEYGLQVASGANANELRSNVAKGNGEYGLYVQDGADGNVVKGNGIAGNGGDGIKLTDSLDNSLYGNRVTGNGGQGVDVNGGTGHLLTRNRVSENGAAGIVSDTNALVLERNTADRNGLLGGLPDGDGLGIEVPAGTTGSGNKARGNDDGNQCEAADVSCHVAP